MEANTQQMMAFAAIDKRIMETIPRPTQEVRSGKDYVYWGDDNLYGEYLFNLYVDVTTLKTICDQSADYVAGDDVIGNVPGMETTINRKGDTWRELIQWLARDWFVFGGCTFQVVRNLRGEISELYYIDFRYIRTDEHNESFFYSKDWAKRYVRTTKTIVYPKYVKDSNEPSSIVYIKNTTSTPYPIPRYSGSIRAAEIERRIDQLHLNGLANGFLPSFMISFNQGIPTDEQRDKIERDITEKFTGSENAGRILLNFSNGKENAATIESVDVQDYGDKYQAAAKRSREMLYTAFGANPCLFGLNTEANGFSEIEFLESFRLYNSTTIRSIQRKFGDVFDKVFGLKGAVTFKPFTLAPKEEDNNNNQTTNVQ